MTNVDPQVVIQKLVDRMSQATVQSVVQEAVIDDLRSQLMQSQAQVSQLSSELTNVTGERDVLTAKVDSLQSTIDGLDRDIEHLQGTGPLPVLQG